jgi:hypothetical protein
VGIAILSAEMANGPEIPDPEKPEE